MDASRQAASTQHSETSELYTIVVPLKPEPLYLGHSVLLQLFSLEVVVAPLVVGGLVVVIVVVGGLVG